MQCSEQNQRILMMKRKSNRTWRTSGMMVSRTAIELCAFYAIIQVCASEVRAGNSNKENIVTSTSTTPMTPINQYVLPVTKQFVPSPKFSPENLKSTESGGKNSSLLTGNELWDGIIGECYKKPTFSCFQKNVYFYLDSTLDAADVNVTNQIKFLKNQIDYTKCSSTKENDPPDKEADISEEPRSESHIEEVTSALYGKSMKFMMTHDLELKMPEVLFDGATFRISPKSIEGNGAIVKLELIPKTEIETRETGRIFKKKILKFFQNKLLLSFLALILIIKLIKVKLFWLLPLIVGVATAKKLVLKFVLFLFPALAHIFKLCSYYHNNYHQTKYHHHHHHINHHHTVVPGWYNDHHDHHPVHAPEIIYTSPPKGVPHEVIHHGPPFHDHFSTGWESSGPGLGSEYISDIHRNAHVDGSGFRPKLDDANEINAWGLAATSSPLTSHSFSVNPLLQDISSSQKTQNLYNTGPVYVRPQPQKSAPAAAQIAAQYNPNLSQQNAIRDVPRTQAQVKEALRIQTEQKLVSQQQKILQQQPFVQDGQPLTPKGYDPFYSPILSKMDKIFSQLGFTDEFCKERLVCSMYKNPNRYSPHSNFISAELSRDTTELEKPTSTNAAVVKFYRLVQAARDGQENLNCMQLYPHCSISTE